MPGFPRNFRHVAEQIYAGGAPDADFLSFFKNTLNGKTVLSLDQGIGTQIDPIVKNLKLNHQIIGLNSSDPHITDNVKKLINTVRSGTLTSNQPIYIHCLHGSDRTGFAIALYRVMKQNWGCDQAISEAVRYGYGQGISIPTQKLWKTILCSKGAITNNTDVAQALDDDIVQTMRDDFDMGNVPSAFTMQQSWAPEIDLQNQPPMYDPTVRNRSLRRKILQNILQDVNDNNIPMVGAFNNYGPMGGAGPVENSGILQLL